MTNTVNKSDFQYLTYKLKDLNDSVKQLVNKKVNIPADLLGYFKDEYDGVVECEIIDVNSYQGTVKVEFTCPLDKRETATYVSIKELSDMKDDTYV